MEMGIKPGILKTEATPKLSEHHSYAVIAIYVFSATCIAAVAL